MCYGVVGQWIIFEYNPSWVSHIFITMLLVLSLLLVPAVRPAAIATNDRTLMFWLNEWTGTI